MPRGPRRRTGVLLCLALVWLAGRPTAQTAAAQLEELYFSARYEAALALLSGAGRPDTMALDPKVAERYRALCLVALGRQEEALAAIETLVALDPLYVLGEADAPPRVREMFHDARRRRLPVVAMDAYVTAKRAYDEQAFEGAAEGFSQVLTILAEPEVKGRMQDLETLASGFRTLAVAAAVAKAEPPPPPPPPPADPPSPGPPRIFSADDPDVVAPATLRQDLPPFPRSVPLRLGTSGVVEVLVDEQGRVERVTMREPVHPAYDPLLVTAASFWQFEPARYQGQAVKFRKLIKVRLGG